MLYYSNSRCNFFQWWINCPKRINGGPIESRSDLERRLLSSRHSFKASPNQSSINLPAIHCSSVRYFHSNPIPSHVNCCIFPASFINPILLMATYPPTTYIPTFLLIYLDNCAHPSQGYLRTSYYYVLPTTPRSPTSYFLLLRSSYLDSCAHPPRSPGSRCSRKTQCCLYSEQTRRRV